MTRSWPRSRLNGDAFMMLLQKRSIHQKRVLPLTSAHARQFRNCIQYAERSSTRIHVWSQRAAGVKLWSSPGHDMITFCNHLVTVLTLTA